MKSADRLFFLPERTHLPLKMEQVEQWYHNLIPGIEKANYSSDELSLLRDKHNYYGKYFSLKDRKFFLSHFAKNLTETINYFWKNKEIPIKFLEIGSGCGNQLILMALLGADVIGCDIREDVCILTKERKVFYEKVSARKLHIQMICNDVLKVDWGSYGKFDAINFLFSFNDVAPGQRLIELITRLIKPHGRLVIQDTNQSNYFNRIFRRRDCMLPQQVAKALELHNFKIHSLQGGYAVPPVFWRILPRSVVASIDRILCRSLFMSPSYHLMAEKL